MSEASQKQTEDLKIYIGKQLKKARINKNITQKELADNAGLSTPTVCNLETGKSGSLETLIKIIQELDMEDRIYIFLPDDLNTNQTPIIPPERKRVRHSK